MIKIKDGVALSGLKEEMLHAIDVMNAVFAEYGVDCVVTSARDAGHKDHSHHYKGLAVDIRSKHLPDHTTKLVIEHRIKLELGPDYQAFLENANRLQEHYHVEYDPVTY